MTTTTNDITPARLTIAEACSALRCSKPFLYGRINSGAINAQRDGARRYISVNELRRYVAACDEQTAA